MAKAKAKQAKKATKKQATKQTASGLIQLKAGVTAEGRRGLMGKMVEAVSKAKKGLTRDELAQRFSKEPRVKVSKNVQWGLRHDVFKEARA